ncbi:hypothetical protein EJB05_31964 [Eragrostis curvula]|uniref:Uncharacterized protein n=1 Tax=Eragrostis curvula TaxID=38414 RepID=A0A5J9UEV1_9POAL|nr:hypothetical protein EJB05_31964 [Eragrostis curvula]
MVKRLNHLCSDLLHGRCMDDDGISVAGDTEKKSMSRRMEGDFVGRFKVFSEFVALKHGDLMALGIGTAAAGGGRFGGDLNGRRTAAAQGPRWVPPIRLCASDWNGRRTVATQGAGRAKSRREEEHLGGGAITSRKRT